ncbi:MAG: DUF6687 family protein [Planctomycetota bacterium]
MSTGIAMNFVAAPAAEQRAFLAGIDGVANNHYDTDGVLALFTLYHPGLALAHRAADAGPRRATTPACRTRRLFWPMRSSRPTPIRRAPPSRLRSQACKMASAISPPPALFARIPEWLQSGIGDRAR